MSIQAMTWALSLPLAPSAKLTLIAIGNYANEDGMCFPSLGRLAADTSQSLSTVVRRLKELQDANALVRFERYTPDGRRTTDEIRLNVKLSAQDLGTHDEPEDEADSHVPTAGDAAGTTAGGPLQSDGVTPSTWRGDPITVEGVTPSLVKGPNEPSLEPSKEQIPPNPPQAGGGDAAVLEAEAWLRQFGAIYPDPISDWMRALTIAQALSGDERTAALTGAEGYRALIATAKARGKDRAVKDAHRWLSGRMWEGYVQAGRAAQAVAARCMIREGTPQWQAWTAFMVMRGQQGIPYFWCLPTQRTAPSRVAEVPQDWPPVGAGFVADERKTRWVKVLAGTQQYAAWRARLSEVDLTSPIATTTFHEREEDFDGRVTMRPVTGLLVPHDWPPNKDQEAAARRRAADKAA